MFHPPKLLDGVSATKCGNHSGQHCQMLTKAAGSLLSVVARLLPCAQEDAHASQRDSNAQHSVNVEESVPKLMTLCIQFGYFAFQIW